MKETSKAMRRRFQEDAIGLFPWLTIMHGKGLDVGPGDDPLQLPNVTLFDKEQGDANELLNTFLPGSFDYIHASQCLEHLHKPEAALWEWTTIVRPGGHIIITVPDFDFYEKRQWPSKHNPDHKAAFSMVRHGFPGVPQFFHVPTMLEGFKKHCQVLKCDLQLGGYNWNAPDNIDQTFPEEGAECFIEFVLKV